MNHDLVVQVSAWIAADPDADDRATLQEFLETGDEAELQRRFASPLTFGTAGLRGPVMAGPAGMNRFTVRRATQGVVAWLEERGADHARGVVVGRDGRHGSEKFNDEVVAVLLGAGIDVYEMPEPLPTPMVAFAVKALRTNAGIMVTASHNPPADNGYKLYDADGAQIIPPNDEIVERHANSCTPPVLGSRSSAHHHVISAELFERYENHFVARFGVDRSDMRITYTPLHGVGGRLMTGLFAAAGYRNVGVVAAQFDPDPQFPTLPFPNPEEPGALDLAMAAADAAGSSLVIANDPDADRLGAAVHGPDGWRVLRGDEIGWLLASWLLPTMSSEDVVATTIVSSMMLEKMAAKAGVRYVSTLTGFKWIARAAGEGVLRFGYEEALGFAVDPLVADKDGLSAALALCRLAHDLGEQGTTLLDRLDEIEGVFGVHAGGQLSLRASGDGALAVVAAAMDRFRTVPPTTLGGQTVSAAVDLAAGWHGLPPTEGLRLELGGLGRVVVRPSGTEPKLKAYIEITVPQEGKLAEQRVRAHSLLESVRVDLAAHLDLGA